MTQIAIIVKVEIIFLFQVGEISRKIMLENNLIINSMLNFIGITYKKLAGKSCFRTYGKITGIREAKESCAYDEKCKGIRTYDSQTSIFYLCYVGHGYHSDLLTHVYDKKGSFS